MCYREGRSVPHAASSSSLLQVAYVVIWDNTRTFAATHYSGSHAHPTSLLLHTKNVNVYRASDRRNDIGLFVRCLVIMNCEVGGEQKREGKSTVHGRMKQYISIDGSKRNISEGCSAARGPQRDPGAVKMKLREREREMSVGDG